MGGPPLSLRRVGGCLEGGREGGGVEGGTYPPPPWVAGKVNTLYPGLWASRPPSTAMTMIAMVIMATKTITMMIG